MKYLSLFIPLFFGKLFAQVNITSTNYSQNFGTTNITSWTDNTTFPGWYKSTTTFSTTNFSSPVNGFNAGGFYAYNCGGSDAKIGSRASSGLSTIYYGIVLRNTTCATIDSLRITYNGYQMSLAENGNVTNTLAFQYTVASAPPPIAGSGTFFPSLNFTNIQNSPVAGGNQIQWYPCTETQTLSAYLPVNIPNNSYILLRWKDVDDLRNDHHMAIDDINIDFYYNSSFTFSISSGSICSGNSFTLSPTGASSYTYSSGSNVVSPITTTNYTVIGESALGCTNTVVATVSVNPSPTISVNNSTVCTGQSATLTASGATSYAWSTGDNTASVVVSPTSSTTYTVTGTSSGCSQNAIANVTVNSLPSLSVNSPTICSGSNATLTPSGASSYTYSSGTNVVSPTAATNYTITGSNASGCLGSVVSSVSVDNLPTISVNSGSICNGSSFTMIPTGASTYAYTGGSATVNPTTNTSYTVTGTSAAGCSNTAVSSVTVNTVPTVAVNSGSICNGSSFTMIPTGASTYAYTGGSATVNPTTNTTYTVTGTSAAGCSNTAVSFVTVNTVPIVAVNSGSICNGSSFTMIPTGASTYAYTGGSATVNPTTNTSYTVTGTSAAGCSNTAVSFVTVNTVPIVAVNSGSICNGSSFTMIPTGASTYAYTGGSATVNPTTNTSYTVTGTTAAGCSNTAISTVTVNAIPTLAVNSGSICNGNSFTLVPSGASTYTYSSGSNIVNPITNTTYTVTGASAQGCNSTAISTVSVNIIPTISVNTGSICTGNSFTIIPSGASTYTYSSGTNVVTPNTNTSYTVTGLSAQGCTNTAVTTVSVNTTPNISVNSGSICSGNSFTLVPSGAVTYTYSSGANTVSPTSNTSYTVIGTSAQGCTNTAVSSISVNATPTISVNSGSICLGNSFTLVPSGASTYTYSSGTNIVSPTTNTNYTVTGTSSVGCQSASGAVSSVTVNAIPSLTLNSGSICTGNSFTIIPSGASTYTYSSGTNVVTPNTNTNYTITGLSAQGCTNTAVATVSVNTTPNVSVNSGSICSGNSFTLVPSGAVTYSYSSVTNTVIPTSNTSYTVIGASAQGCTNTAVSSISVNATPTISVNSGSICLGNSFTLVPSGASTYTYSSGTNTVSPTTTSNYTVTGTSSVGCQSASGAVSSVTVNAIPSLTLNSGSICTGNSFTLVPSGASTYTYSSGTNVVTPNTNTSYTVTGLSAQGCTNTAVTTVSVNITPNVSVNSGSICSGNSFTLVPSGAVTYSYSSGANVVSPTINTTYTVTGASVQGCTNTAVSSISVNATPTISVNSGSICSGNSFTLIPSGASTYTYSSGSNTVSPATNTSYIVIGASSAGCINTAITTVSVSATPTISVNSGSICSGNSFTIIPSGAATYTYSSGINIVSPITTATYTVFGASTTGCLSSKTTTVLVNATPTLSINSASICTGSSFTFNPSGASSYTISVGGTVVSPTITSSYTVTGISVSGCLATKVITLTVNAIPSLSVNSGTLCSGRSFTLSPSGASTYTYSSGSSVNSPTITTTYTVTGANAVGCLSNAISTVSVIPLPALSVNSSTICAGQTAILTATGAVNYLWNTLALTNSLTVTPNATTSYTVIGAANGCTISAVSNVSVIPLPPVAVNSTTICAGETTTILATGATNYIWNSGSTVNPLILTPASTANYSVVGSANGCTNVAVSNVVVNTVPIVTVNSETICVGQTTTLTANGALNYAWNTGALSFSLTVSPIATTQYTVVGQSNGCSSFAVSTVSVNPLPVLTITADTICSGQFAFLYVLGASTYTWNNGVNGNVIHVNPLTTTAYSVTGTTNNCSSVISTTVTVFESPFISFNTDVFYGCDSLCVNFADLTTVSTAGIASWNWSFGDGVTSTIQNPYYCYHDTGYYDVSLTITTTQGCSGTILKPRAISIFPSPIASFTFDPSAADVLNPTFDFTNQSSNAVSYQWSFGDSENTSQTDPSHAYLTEGVYTVTLIATSDYGCMDVTTNTLTVKELFTFYAPNVFTPNEDRFNNVFKPIGRGWDITSYELLIFDRWGTLCFTSTDVTIGWDGRALNGTEVAQIDTYTWKVKLSEATGKKHNYIGKLILLK